MRRYFNILCLLSVFCLLMGSIGLAEEVGKKKLKEQMQRKLSNTQDLLEGIVMEDFEKIRKSANNLVDVCEVVGWTEEKTKGQFKDYDTHFHDLASELVALADARNLEGSQNKYNQVVMMCINCHQHVRDVEASEKYPGGTHKGEYLYEGKHIHSR
ncbi:MAG: hypothetical protein E3K32_13025 [wastewater metagenome]|nr:hypothetical protein [Candidatus Loosdrechtia aerotolerans]